MSPFLEVPTEVQLLILSYLDVRDVFLLRQTCREVSELTRDKSVWLDFLRRFRESGDIPLPSAAGDPAITDIDSSSSTLQSIVVSATRASESWLLPRELRPVPIPVRSQVLDGLNIFLDTWLLIVYVDGLVYLRSLRENAPRQGDCAILDLRETGKRWKSHYAVLAPGNKHIMLAMSNNKPPFDTVLYQIAIDGVDLATEFNLIQTFTGHRTRTIRALDTASRLLVLSSVAGTLDIVSWDSEQVETSSMSLDDAADEWFDGVVALRLLGSYFLAVRTHTIELHAFDNAAQPERSTKPLKHSLPFPLGERSVSISDAITAPSSDSGSKRININVLAYDTHCIATYAVAIVLPDAMSTGVRPTMDVTLIGEMRPARPEAHVGGHTRSHWFVSALALGPQAIRAMWIERHSLTMTRYVRLCTLNRDATWHEMEMATSVFTLPSYDLRDDLTHCALAEVSGRIVLGNRAGHVFLLTPTSPAPQRLN
ncbi:hypothetical protein FB451DRAFT_104314 [Mycena latifolia]|nr:hypothetical protein FB451DRAFT_104314 [Mycena latifolia]